MNLHSQWLKKWILITPQIDVTLLWKASTTTTPTGRTVCGSVSAPCCLCNHCTHQTTSTHIANDKSPRIKTVLQLCQSLSLHDGMIRWRKFVGAQKPQPAELLKPVHTYSSIQWVNSVTVLYTCTLSMYTVQYYGVKQTRLQYTDFCQLISFHDQDIK